MRHTELLRLNGPRAEPDGETHHGDGEAGATRPQHVAQRDPAVLQDDVGGGRGSDAQLVLLLAQRKPGVGHGHQEGADTLQARQGGLETRRTDGPGSDLSSCLVSERLVRGGEHNGGRGVPAVGDPGLGAVQDPLVPLLTGHRGGGAGVAAVTCGVGGQGMSRRLKRT